MARRKINTRSKPRLVKTTIHEDLYNIMEKFRRDYMKMSGKYVNNSVATEALAKRISNIKPKKIPKRRVYFL